MIIRFNKLKKEDQIKKKNEQQRLKEIEEEKSGPSHSMEDSRHSSGVEDHADGASPEIDCENFYTDRA